MYIAGPKSYLIAGMQFSSPVLCNYEMLIWYTLVFNVEGHKYPQVNLPVVRHSPHLLSKLSQKTPSQP